MSKEYRIFLNSLCPRSIFDLKNLRNIIAIANMADHANYDWRLTKEQRMC